MSQSTKSRSIARSRVWPRILEIASEKLGQPIANETIARIYRATIRAGGMHAGLFEDYSASGVFRLRSGRYVMVLAADGVREGRRVYDDVLADRVRVHAAKSLEELLRRANLPLADYLDDRILPERPWCGIVARSIDAGMLEPGGLRTIPFTREPFGAKSLTAAGGYGGRIVEATHRGPRRMDVVDRVYLGLNGEYLRIGGNMISGRGYATDVGVAANFNVDDATPYRLLVKNTSEEPRRVIVKVRGWGSQPNAARADEKPHFSIKKRLRDVEDWLVIEGAELDVDPSETAPGDRWSRDYVRFRVDICEPDDEIRAHYDVDSVVSAIREKVIARLGGQKAIEKVYQHRGAHAPARGAGRAKPVVVIERAGFWWLNVEVYR